MPLLRSSSLVIWVAVVRVSTAGSAAAAAGEEESWACAAISFFCAAGKQSASTGLQGAQQQPPAARCRGTRDRQISRDNTTCRQRPGRCPASSSPPLPISLSLSQSPTVLPHHNAVGCALLPAGLPKQEHPVLHHLCSAENRSCCEQAEDRPCFQLCP